MFKLCEAQASEINGYSEFFETIDTILMGKRTYDWIMEQEKGQFPYATKSSYVFSRSSVMDTKDVTFVNEDIVDFTNNLRTEEGKDIWIVGGGDILHTFLKEKVVDELIITVAPIIIGGGIPLFKPDEYDWFTVILRAILEKVLSSFKVEGPN